MLLKLLVKLFHTQTQSSCDETMLLRQVTAFLLTKSHGGVNLESRTFTF
jgi:hypothetical protein